MFYWFFTITLTLMTVLFVSRVLFPTIKFISTLIRNMFCKCPDSFAPVIIVNAFRFMSPILLETNILPNQSFVVVQLPITPICTDDEWVIVIKFIGIQIIRLQSNHMHTHFMTNDLTKPNNNITNKISILLMNPGI